MDRFGTAFDEGFRSELHKQAKVKLPVGVAKKALSTRPLGLLAALKAKPKRKK